MCVLFEFETHGICALGSSVFLPSSSLNSLHFAFVELISTLKKLQKQIHKEPVADITTTNHPGTNLLHAKCNLFGRFGKLTESLYSIFCLTGPILF